MCACVYMYTSHTYTWNYCICNMYYFILHVSNNILLSYIYGITTPWCILLSGICMYIYVYVYIHTYMKLYQYIVFIIDTVYIYIFNFCICLYSDISFLVLPLKRNDGTLWLVQLKHYYLFCRPDWNFFLPCPICLLLHLSPLRYCHHFFLNFRGFIDRDI